MAGWHIAISGLMGAGKSTLVRALGSELDYLPLEEKFEENPFLRQFYSDPPSWAFKSYVFFLQRTLDDYRRAQEADRGSVQERVIEEHLVVFGEEFHARGYLDQDELAILKDLTLTASQLGGLPDLLIYIAIDPYEALARLRHRASPMERDIQLEYLNSLNSRYMNLLENWKGEVLHLDAAAHDFRKAPEVKALAKVICERLDSRADSRAGDSSARTSSIAR